MDADTHEDREGTRAQRRDDHEGPRNSLRRRQGVSDRWPGCGVGSHQRQTDRTKGSDRQRHHLVCDRSSRDQSDTETDRDVHSGRRLHLSHHLDLRHGHGLREQDFEDHSGRHRVHQLDRRDRAGQHRRRGCEGRKHFGRPAFSRDQFSRGLRRTRQSCRQGHGRGEQGSRHCR